MLRLIPLRRFDALMSLRPTMNRHIVPTCSHRRLFSDSPAAATAAAAAKDQRRWVMLSRHASRINESFVADSNTVTEAPTSTGRHLRVSLRCAAPPASSKLYYDFPEEEGGNDNEYLNVVAAHGELLLLEMGCDYTEDHFVYMPAGPARPASLSLLPVRDFLTRTMCMWLKSKFGSIWFNIPLITLAREDAPDTVQPPTDSAGLLRRGENDVLVVHVHMWFDLHAPRGWGRLMAEFCVLRPGMRQWKFIEPVPILHGLGGNKGADRILKSHKSVSVGDRFLCWVHYSSGFLLCDMADEASPKAHYVHFPDEVSCCDDKSDDDDDDDSGCNDDDDDSGCDDDSDDDDDDYISWDEDEITWDEDEITWDDESDDNDPTSVRYMGATSDRNVRLVSIDPHGVSGFTIKTWTMNLGTDEPLAWVKDGEIDCEEVWKLPGYEGLPRLTQANLQCTVVWFDLDNPNVVNLLVCNGYTSRDEKIWMIQLNMKTKMLLSAVQLFTNDPCLPVQLQY